MPENYKIYNSFLSLFPFPPKSFLPAHAYKQCPRQLKILLSSLIPFFSRLSSFISSSLLCPQCFAFRCCCCYCLRIPSRLLVLDNVFFFFFPLARLFFLFISFFLLYSCIIILQPLLDFSALCRFAAAVCIGSQKLQEGSLRNSFIPVVVVVVTTLLLIWGFFLVHWIINESLRNSLDQ